jgi:hypothetical protein
MKEIETLKNSIKDDLAKLVDLQKQLNEKKYDKRIYEVIW